MKPDFEPFDIVELTQVEIGLNSFFLEGFKVMIRSLEGGEFSLQILKKFQNIEIEKIIQRLQKLPGQLQFIEESKVGLDKVCLETGRDLFEVLDKGEFFVN